MQRELLPNRPLRLTSRYRGNRIVPIVMMCFAWVFVVLMFGVVTIDELHAIDREQAIWDAGTNCEDGGQFSQLGKHELGITCVDADGVTHNATQKFPNLELIDLFGGRAGVIRYDPATPNMFAISGGIDAIARRRSDTRVPFFGVAALSALLLGIPLTRTRVLLRDRKVARRGDELPVHIVRVETVWRRKQPTHVRYVYWKIDPAAKIPFKTKMDRDKSLAWLDADSPRALALVSADRRHGLLLTGTLEPLDVSDDERAATMAALATAGGGQARLLEEIGLVVIAPKPASPAPPTPIA